MGKKGRYMCTEKANERQKDQKIERKEFTGEKEQRTT